MTQTKLNPLQLELLKIYAMNPSEEDLLAIKTMLGRYFAQKLRKQIDNAVQEKGITNEDLDNWINE